MRDVAKIANVTYEYVYETAIGFYKENKKGDPETMKLLNVEKPAWRHEEEKADYEVNILIEILDLI